MREGHTENEVPAMVTGGWRKVERAEGGGRGTGRNPRMVAED